MSITWNYFTATVNQQNLHLAWVDRYIYIFFFAQLHYTSLLLWSKFTLD